jgi:hypothetical protein
MLLELRLLRPLLPARCVPRRRSISAKTGT